MGKKAIKINCEGATTLKHSALTVIQGDLKSLSEDNYEKLKKQILKYGFSAPFSVWKGTGDFSGKNCVLDGTQRFRTVGKLIEEGYECPDLPVDWIKASNYKDAKRILLSLASQYGKIDKQGLYEFLMDTDLSLDEIDDYSFPELKIDKFKMEYFDELKEEQIPYITDHDKQFIVAVELQDEVSMNKLYEELKKRGLECRLIV